MKPQHNRILEALRQSGGSTTVQMQRELNIVDVRKRISELRQMGYFIRDSKEPNATSGSHKRYCLEEGTTSAEDFRKLVVEDGWDVMVALETVESAIDDTNALMEFGMDGSDDPFDLQHESEA